MNLPHVVAEPQVASDNMFKKPNCLSLNELVDHVAKDSPNSVESFICMANVRQTCFVKKNLLHDENSNGFR